ncbi:hypothetical protein [Paenibacillus antibioticophila]|nr:hypothetical protein [Paenibacillus antibioticophila]
MATLDTQRLYYNYEALPNPVVPENPTEDQTPDTAKNLKMP